MAKEIAISKIAKISQAQQYMILSVLGASLFLGAGISLTIRFSNQIAFNAKVIAAEEESIASYSSIIKNSGICPKPKGEAYSDEELKKCDPYSLELSQVPGTLRANVLQSLVANSALNSVPKEDTSDCVNPDTGKNYTYKELNELYNNTTGATERQAAFQRIKTCSALRIIPDALPAFKNEEALLASLNRIFNLSNWSPESLRPSGNSVASDLGNGLNAIEVKFTIEASAGVATTILNNIERSIRDFNVNSANIEWSKGDTLEMNTNATAYYMDESAVSESNKKITAGGK